jgi:hypothetical protein
MFRNIHMGPSLPDHMLLISVASSTSVTWRYQHLVDLPLGSLSNLDPTFQSVVRSTALKHTA